MNSLIATATAVVVVAFIGSCAVALGRRAGIALGLAIFVAVVSLSPSRSEALEVRQSDDGVLRVEASETIDDTLIALADTIEIDGTIEGDLIALGRVVVVRGRVGGQVTALGRSVTVSGNVAGSVLGLGETVNVSADEIGRNLFGFANTLNTSPNTRIGQNAVVFVQSARLEGAVERDVLGFANQLEIGTAIDGDLSTWTSEVTLLAAARVAGDFTAHVESEGDVSAFSSSGTRCTERPRLRERAVPTPRGRRAAQGWASGGENASGERSRR